jgi:hypothetical protein
LLKLSGHSNTTSSFFFGAAEASGDNELVLPAIDKVDYSNYSIGNVSAPRIGGSTSKAGYEPVHDSTDTDFDRNSFRRNITDIYKEVYVTIHEKDAEETTPKGDVLLPTDGPNAEPPLAPAAETRGNKVTLTFWGKDCGSKSEPCCLKAFFSLLRKLGGSIPPRTGIIP